MYAMNKHNALIICYLLISFSIKAQTSISADDLFKNARSAAFEEKNYDKAKQFAYEALQISPSYSDIEIFLGRLCTWNKQYDSARYHFSKVLNTDSANKDASIAYTDLEYWNDNFAEALRVCNLALNIDSSSEELLLRKVKILNAEKNYKEASIVIDKLLKINKSNPAAIALANKLRDARAVNKVSVSYDHSSFNKQFDKPWQFASISYSRLTKRGTIIARINYANRFNTNGVQGEVDAYPHISKTFYSYINFGYSEDVGVFPKFRGGFSLYANLPKSFEAEIGMRYLYFTSPTSIYTTYIGKYYKNFLFGARTYITPSNSSVSQSYSLSARYYLKGADDYIGLTAGSGISPDDNNQNIQIGNKLNKLSSKKISANFDHTFLKRNIISLSASLINQEYQPSLKGNQVDISIGLSHRF
jgi:YaiO family outer membrane protein